MKIQTHFVFRPAISTFHPCPRSRFCGVSDNGKTERRAKITRNFKGRFIFHRPIISKFKPDDNVGAARDRFLLQQQFVSRRDAQKGAPAWKQPGRNIFPLVSMVQADGTWHGNRKGQNGRAGVVRAGDWTVARGNIFKLLADADLLLTQKGRGIWCRRQSFWRPRTFRNSSVIARWVLSKAGCEIQPGGALPINCASGPRRKPCQAAWAY